MTTTQFDLTFAQQGIWEAQQLDPESAHYVVGEVVELAAHAGDTIDVDALLEAIVKTQVDADALRLRFTADERGGAHQYVTTDINPPRTVDVSGHPHPQVVAAGLVDHFRADFASQAMRLTEGALAEYVVISLDDQHAWIVQLYHHIIVDGYSAMMLTARIAAHYNHLRAGTPIREFRGVSIEELVEEDAQYRQSQQYSDDAKFWKDYLGDLELDSSRIDANIAAGATRSGQTTTTTLTVPENLVAGLKALAPQGGSWVESLLGCYAALVHRVLGGAEVVLALPLMSRTTRAARTTPLMAVNIGVLRVPTQPGASLRELVAEVVIASRQVRAHQRFRGEWLPAATGNPAVSHALHGVGVNAKAFATTFDFSGATAYLRNVAGGPPEDWGLVANPGPDGSIELGFETDPVRVPPQLARQRLKSLLTVIAAAVDDPEQKVTDIPTMSKEELRFLLARHSRTPFAEVPRSPRRPVGTGRLITDEDGATADELFASARTLGEHLKSEAKKHEVDEPILLLQAPRSLETITVMLACLYAGVTWCYLEPDAPEERRRHIAEDVDPTWYIHLESDAPGSSLLKSPPLDGYADNHRRESGDTDVMAWLKQSPEKLAYICYTSGSTGLPKGVEVPRRALHALLKAHLKGLYATDTTEVVAHTASLSFDAALDQLFWIIAGHNVRLYSKDFTADPEEMIASLARDEVSVFDTTPSLLAALVRAGALTRLPKLRTIIVGGEACPQELFDEVQASHRDIYNAYGPTEATVDALLAPSLSGPVSIGHPLSSMQAYVVDSAGQLIADGEVGELLLAGKQLARGYRNLPEETAHRFVDGCTLDPAIGPQRIYRTGDRVVWTPESGYRFLGRSDGQVEINGQRFELGEIDAAITRLDSINEAAVGLSGQGLIAAIVPASSSYPGDLEMRRQLGAYLPPAGIPARYVTVEQLPVTTSGKIDRAAIATWAHTDEDHAGDNDQVLDTELDGAEAALAVAVAEATGGAVDIDRDFLGNGGDSITALMVATGVRELGYKVAPRELLAATSLRTAALGLEEIEATTNTLGHEREQHAAVNSVASMAEIGTYRLSDVAQRQLAASPDETAMRRHALYREVSVPKVSGEAMEWAISEMMRRHGALRSILIDNETMLVPRTAAVDADAIIDEDSPEHTQATAFALASALDPHAGIMWIIAPLARSDDPDNKRHKVVVVVHHLAIDAVSWPILVHDLCLALSGHVLTANNAAELSPRPHALGLHPAQSHQQLPTVPGPWQSVTTTLDIKPSAVLIDRDLHRRLHATVDDVAAAALSYAMRSHRPALADQEFTIISEGHGRTGGERVIGWFTQETVLTTKPVAKDEAASNIAEITTLLAEIRQARSTPSYPRNSGALPMELPVALNLVPAPNNDEGADTSDTQAFHVIDDPRRARTEPLAVNIFLPGADGRATIEFTAVNSIYTASDCEAIAAYLQRALELLRGAGIAGAQGLIPKDVTAEVSPQDLRRITGTHARIRDVFVMPPNQQGLFAFAHSSDDHDPYVVASGIELHVAGIKGIDTARLNNAFQQATRRHSVSIGAIDTIHPEWMIIPEHVAMPMALTDASDTDLALARQIAAHRAQRMGERTVDIHTSPMIAVELVLYPVPDDDSQPCGQLILGGHHGLTDGWSTQIMLRDIERIYNDEPLPPAGNYADYASALASRDTTAEADFWAEHLSGFARPSLVADGANHPDRGERTVDLTPVAGCDEEEIDAACERYGVTRNALICSAWATTVSAATGDSDVAFGIVATGRNLPGQPVANLDNVVGPCLNTVPVRVRTGQALTPSSLVRNVSERLFDVQQWEISPAAAISAAWGKPAAELFDTAVVYENFPQAGRTTTRTDPGVMHFGAMHAIGRTHYPVSLVCLPGDELSMLLAFDTARISTERATMLAELFTVHLAALVQGVLPEIPDPEVSRDARHPARVSVSADGGLVRDIATAMSTELGGYIPTANEDYFSLGGTSLSAVRVIAALRKKGHRVPMRTFIEGRSAGQIAGMVGAFKGEAHTRVTAARQQEAVVWLVPPVVAEPGIVDKLEERLTDKLGDLTVRALPVPTDLVGLHDPSSLETDEFWEDTVDQVVARYLEVIADDGDPKPLRMMGYSFGAVIGQKLIDAAAARGWDTELFIALDAYPLGHAPAVPADTIKSWRALGAADSSARAGMASYLSHEDSTPVTAQVILVTADYLDDNSTHAGRDAWDPASEWEKVTDRLAHISLAVTHEELVDERGVRMLQRRLPKLIEQVRGES